MAEKHLDIVIATKNLLSRGFREAHQQAQSFAGRMNKTFDVGVGGVAKLAGAVGALLAVLKVSQTALRAYHDEVSGIALDYSKLDFGWKDKAVSAIPIFGRLYDLFRDIRLEAFGTGQALREQLKLQQQLSEQHAENLRKIQIEKRVQEGLAALQKQINAEARMRAEGPAARVDIEREERRKRVEELYKESAKVAPLSDYQKRQRAETLAQIEKAAQAKLADIQKKAAEEERARVKKAADELDGLRSRLRQRALEAQKRHGDAEVEQIRENYRRQIDEAKSEQAKLALEALMEIEVRAARRLDAGRQMREQAAERARTQENVALSSRFLGLAARGRFEQQMADHAARQTEELQGIGDILDQINSKMDDQTPIAVGSG